MLRNVDGSFSIFCTVNTVIDLCLATRSVELWRNICASLLYFVVCVPRRRKKSSSSLSHLLMSFLSIYNVLTRPRPETSGLRCSQCVHSGHLTSV